MSTSGGLIRRWVSDVLPMNNCWLTLGLLCLVIFHAPDGTLVSVEKQHIAAIRPISDNIKEHLAPGTKTILYVGNHKIGITETLEEAETMLEGCEQ